jgi:hypothetical protein
MGPVVALVVSLAGEMVEAEEAEMCMTVVAYHTVALWHVRILFFYHTISPHPDPGKERACDTAYFRDSTVRQVNRST